METTQEILNFNEKCAEFLGWKSPNSDSSFYIENFSRILNYENTIDLSYHWFRVEDLLFDSDWNWLMKVSNKIQTLGYRKYTYSHEEHSRCVFTDMVIVTQSHDFGGGNIVADSGECRNEKEAMIKAINEFLINNEI